MQNQRHIFLVGMMGTGKTEVGKRLSKQLSCPCVDTDKELESQWGYTIPQFFARYDEEAFRKEEQTMLATLVRIPKRTIITTGGGIILKKENRELMRQYGTVVWLQADPDELIRRLQADDSRPLLQGDRVATIRKLSAEREKKYQFADIKIDTTGKLIGDVVLEVKTCLNLYQEGDDIR